MKFLVFCIIVIANVSNKGKASLDSIVPATNRVLFEDTTLTSDNSCYRPCKLNVKPRRCNYHFKIEPSINEDSRSAITVNGLSPGPAIHVCVNDIIVVEVENKVPDQDLAIHWHGVEQNGTPYMDGVPMVTQCPISYGATYKYAFRASSPGTFFYHSDSVNHQSDGVYGALVVNQPQPLDAHSTLYDYDRSAENTLIIGAVFPELLTANLNDLSELKPSSLIINGYDKSSRLFVLPGFSYRLRIINAIAVECPVEMDIDKHDIIVITSDGKPVKPVVTRKVKIYPGERMDVVVRASQNSGGYWVRMSGTGACAGLAAHAMFLYSGFNYTSMLEQEVLHQDANQLADQVIFGQMLESLQDTTSPDEVKHIYLELSKKKMNKDIANDFRYISDAIPKKPFVPVALSLQEEGVTQINGKNFLYPGSTFLLRPRDAPTKEICVVGEESKHPDMQCTQVINAEHGETLEIVLVNEGVNTDKDYIFHLHGQSAQIVATWQNTEKEAVTKEIFIQMDKEGNVSRNLLNPPLKDTILVPNKGYTVIRIRPEAGGSWMLECRACSLSSLPVAVVINVPLSLPKAITDTLPRCGTYRPPDVLLH